MSRLINQLQIMKLGISGHPPIVTTIIVLYTPIRWFDHYECPCREAVRAVSRSIRPPTNGSATLMTALLSMLFYGPIRSAKVNQHQAGPDF